MVLLENEAFLSALVSMYNKSKLAGSIIVTLKRYDGRTKPAPRGELVPPEPDEYSCLYRASLRSEKISTIVKADGLAVFQTSFSNVIKSNMDALKKLKKNKPKHKSKALKTQ